MKIRYTKHGDERLKQRRISKRDVKAAIDFGRKSDASGGSRKSTHKNQNGALVVIYNIRSSSSVEIITAYYE